LYKPYPYSETDGRNILSEEGSLHVLRGGAWNDVNPDHCRCADRLETVPVYSDFINGFRCARTLQDQIEHNISRTITIPQEEIEEPNLELNARITEDLPFVADAGSNYIIDVGSGVSMDMVWIRAGGFVMGSPESETGRGDDEGPRTNVSFEGFWMGKYEVTQAQYQSIMGTNPSFFSNNGASNPVEQVSWDDAMEFCRKLSEKTEKKYTLPTEAQWEYACRAGTITAYSFGNYENQLGNYAWWLGNSVSATHPVGQKEPNSWGLYDMHGNVWEWCLSLYKPYPYSETDGRNILSEEGSGRVLRGGSWSLNAPDYFRCAYRLGYLYPSDRVNDFGFRCARTLY
jgi:formylglycine-generating enzyme required for sulfatase activity